MGNLLSLLDNFRLTFLICFTISLINHCFADLRHGYSMLQYGHKLDRRMITSYDRYGILDCVEDCLRTTRCQSINYHQGAHFCQTNFESKVSIPAQYIEKPGWIYSAKTDWDKEIAGACSKSNCALNKKCIPKAFGQSDCILSDCGIPSGEGFSMDNVREWDAIGIARGIHITCSSRYQQQDSERFICLSNGLWKTDLKCTLEACPDGYTEVWSNSTRACLRFVATQKTYSSAKISCTEDGGDLVKIDTEDVRLIFLQFIKEHVSGSGKNNIWIQSEKDANSIWRFHDGTNMPDFLRKYIDATNNPDETSLRYVISVKRLLDKAPYTEYSFVCEYRFN